MTDREFHEIQLSGKQLVFLFISLVVLAVVTFLLGVAVGKGVRGDMMDAPTSAAAATEAVVPEEPPVQPAQELGYHDLLAGSGTPPAASGPPPTPPAENTPPPAPITEPIPAPAPAQTPPAAPAPPAATGDWFLQTGAYSGRQAADNQVAALKKLNVPAFVLVPAAGAPDRFFRVRVGPYGTQAEADAVRARLVREGFTQTRIQK